MPTQIELGNIGKPTSEVERELVKPQFNFVEFLKEVRSEFVKISWPSTDQVSKEFFSVILLVAALTGTIYLIDKVLEMIVNFFNGRL